MLKKPIFYFSAELKVEIMSDFQIIEQTNFLLMVKSKIFTDSGNHTLWPGYHCQFVIRVRSKLWKVFGFEGKEKLSLPLPQKPQWLFLMGKRLEALF